MRIAICSVQTPFVRGGAEFLFENLYNEMKLRGYEVEHIEIPFKWYPPQEIINHAMAWKLLDLSESNGKKIDGLICQKFPSYLVNHPNKVVWLLHQHRPSYDLAYTELDDMLQYGEIGQIVKKKIHMLDNEHLQKVQKIYTISQNVTRRLMNYNNIESEVLYHPPPQIGKYYCENYDNYIFYPSRLDLAKRQSLVIKSMKYIDSNIRLKIAGSGPQLDDYKKLAKECAVEDRVDFLGFVSNEELIELYANAFCVTYVPVDEDMGYVTMEAFLSKKPVITCSDSGGPLEFVEDGINGYVSDPNPKKIAEKVKQLYENGLVEKMGKHGFKKINNMNLSWDHVIKKLMESMK